ncbi:transposase family protein [Streptomyces sp. NPDC057555]|uniref:transposase family protein n=1 Tax=Streptomyces sp. NPDC057555 TaxID=3346166 RepID=UPI003692FC29
MTHLLAARAERLDRALKRTVKKGGAMVLIDGTLIPTRRRTGTDNRPNYSGKRKMHGLHVLGLDDDPDNPVIITGYRAARGRRLTPAQKEANRLVARERAANEHGFADLKNWRILTKLHLGTRNATALLRALLVLTCAEISR